MHVNHIQNHILRNQVQIYHYQNSVTLVKVEMNDQMALNVIFAGFAVNRGSEKNLINDQFWGESILKSYQLVHCFLMTFK